MIPVLQPSMLASCRTIQYQQHDDNVDDDNSNSNSNDQQKNETTNITKENNGKPVLLSLLQSRLRSYYISYRRHRYLRRSLLLLWAIVVFNSTYLLSMAGSGEKVEIAWIGESVMEVLSITTTPPVDICFITAQYASSMEQTDRLVNLRKESPQFFTEERNKSFFHFFAFTNRRDWIAKTTTREEEEEDEEGKNSKKKTRATQTKNGGADDGADNGWTILLQEFPPQTFQRFITQSRWPKFQGFRHETIQGKCDVVFYMDGTVLPKGSPWKFQREARRILDSEAQFSQQLHPNANKDGGGIAGEMERCRVKNKDIEINLQTTKEWFQAQPDFINDCVLYQNTYFGYAVTSPSFRTAADFAWGRFSLEQDSWRDQPLWCYTLHHFGIQPLIIPSTLFEYQGDRKGGNKHTYGLDAATNAQQYYDNNNNNNNNSNNSNNNNQGNKNDSDNRNDNNQD